MSVKGRARKLAPTSERAQIESAVHSIPRSRDWANMLPGLNSRCLGEARPNKLGPGLGSSEARKGGPRDPHRPQRDPDPPSPEPFRERLRLPRR